MRLKELIEHSSIAKILGSLEVEVNSITFDSRKAKAGTLFVAQKGSKTDGHQFIDSAINNGSEAILCEELPAEIKKNISYIQVANSNLVLGEIASIYYGNPSSKLKVTGITGTNGKTSIATLLYNLFLELGYKVGLISTISYCINGINEVATHTTPDALKLQQLFQEMVNQGCEFCFMEVSSHAVHQNRIAGIHFTGGVFTNITHDHLDYHKTFAEYIKAKKGFFDILPKTAFAITNTDDKNGLVMLQNTKAKKITFATNKMADFHCKVLESHFDGMLLDFSGKEIWTHFVGKFNASNLLAVHTTAIQLHQDSEEVLTIISKLTPVRGRFETIKSLDGKLAIVDYAHTPDALKNVLATIAEIRTRNEQVITVIGAGGDRDKTKRPIMTKEALLGSDKVILTSDNPRTENPAEIIKDMEKGIDPPYKNRVLSIENRKEAIKTATFLAQPGDIILVAGKGHEDYQEINGVKHHFDDKEVIKEFFGIE